MMELQELVGREDMALRMSAAALLYNIALHLPKVGGPFLSSSHPRTG